MYVYRIIWNTLLMLWDSLKGTYDDIWCDACRFMSCSCKTETSLWKAFHHLYLSSFSVFLVIASNLLYAIVQILLKSEHLGTYLNDFFHSVYLIEWIICVTKAAKEGDGLFDLNLTHDDSLPCFLHSQRRKARHQKHLNNIVLSFKN